MVVSWRSKGALFGGGWFVSLFLNIILHDYKNAGMHKNSMIMLISNMYIQKMKGLLKLLKLNTVTILVLTTAMQCYFKHDS